MAGATSDIVVGPGDVERALDALLADRDSASADRTAQCRECAENGQLQQAYSAVDS